MATPLERQPGAAFSPSAPLGDAAPEGSPAAGWLEGKALLQHIGWRRPSEEERRWWLVQGAVIVGAVLLIGTLMLLALR